MLVARSGGKVNIRVRVVLLPEFTLPKNVHTLIHQYLDSRLFHSWTSTHSVIFDCKSSEYITNSIDRCHGYKV